MGACLSDRIKNQTQTPFQKGEISKNMEKNVRSLGNLSSTTKSASMLLSHPLLHRSKDEILLFSKLKKFTFDELRDATRNFRPDSVVGEGGFGSVFKGWIDEHSKLAATPGSGLAIAVKKLNQEGLQGHKEWLAEIYYLGQLKHPNLVKLLGYCLEDDHRLLVYEFMVKGSMENHLFRRGSYFQPFSWSLRIKVALGAAKGLAFLHSAEAKVIYRDFKTSNILLDSNYNAKLSDFGLARDGPAGDESYVSTRVLGTMGYAAPEYIVTGHLSTKSDVYSFGVVFLEMLTNRRAIDQSRPIREQNLVSWARPLLTSKRRIFHIIDPRLNGEYSLEQALMAANIALRCLSVDPKSRPSMDEVVAALERIQERNEVGLVKNLRKENHVSSNVHKSFKNSASLHTPLKNFNDVII